MELNRIKARPLVLDLERTFIPVSLISELTSKCNLRCTYCPKGDMNKDIWNATPGRDDHMEGVALERYMEAASSVGFHQIQLSGVGEFSFHPDWVRLGTRIHEESGSEISVVSNFGRIFTTEELDFLLKLFHIMVSIDTPDLALLKKVRKVVDIRAVTTNMINLRARATETGRRMPIIKINGTIYAENLTHIHALACYAASVRVDMFQLTRVSLSETNDFPHPITAASVEDAAEALRQMDLARQVCAGAQIHYIEFGDLRSELIRLAKPLPAVA